MFAISFDMTVSSLEEHYGKPYNRAYYEIKECLKKITDRKSSYFADL